MSFGRQSDVHNHLSTKHPLFSHKMVEDGTHDKILEPEHVEGRFSERAPPFMVEDPEEAPSHS